MARIPAYIDRSSASSGSPFMRFVDADTRSARALGGLGRALAGAGADALETDQRLRDAAARQAQADDRTRLESALLDYDAELNEQLAARSEAMPEGGVGFSAEYGQFADDRAAAIIRDKFADREDQEEIALRFQQTRQSYIKSAAAREVDARIEWRDGVAKRKVESLAGTLGAQVASAYAGGAVDPSVASAAAYKRAEAEWAEYVSATFGSSGRVRQIATDRGRAALQKSFVDAYATANPRDFVQRFNQVYRGTPAPTSRHAPQAQTIHDAFSAVGLDHKIGGAIWEIESRRGAIKAPIGTDGKPMSSARGDWQILDGVARDLGIQDRDDFEATTPAVAAHLASHTKRLERAGFTATPGRTYMAWNVGPGAALALLRADPNALVDDVLTRVWAKQGPAFIEQALKNNPSMYRRGMTVQQVLDNYEAKVASATKRTADLWSRGAADVDAQAMAVVADLLPGATDQLAAADIHEIMDRTAKRLKEDQKSEAEYRLGAGLLSGDIRPEPSNQDHRRALDAVVGDNVNVDGIVTGDLNAHNGIVALVSRTRIVPQRVATALSDTVRAAGVDNPGKTASYLTMARIANDYPEAWDNAAIDGEVKSRVREFLVNTDVLRLDHATAIRRIEDAYTPEGKRMRESMAAQVKNELRNGARTELGGRDRVWAKIEKHFDDAWFDGVTVGEWQREVAVDAYEAAYRDNRVAGKTVEEAEASALLDMSRNWGMTGVNGDRTLSPAPVEMNYPAVGGSHDWIAKQARNIVATHVSQTGELGSLQKQIYDATSNMFGSSKAGVGEVRVLARAETMDDIRNGRKAPRYSIAYRRPDGTVSVVPGLHSFDPEVAVSALRDDFVVGARRTRSARQSNFDGPMAP